MLMDCFPFSSIRELSLTVTAGKRVGVFTISPLSKEFPRPVLSPERRRGQGCINCLQDVYTGEVLLHRIYFELWDPEIAQFKCLE